MFSMDYTGLEALYTDLKKLTDDISETSKKVFKLFNLPHQSKAPH